MFYPIKYKELVEHYSVLYDVDRNLIYAVIKTESGFDPNAVSPKNAVGLMQIMPKTAEYVCGHMGVKYDQKKLKEPEYNIKIGVYYLRYLSDKFESVDAAVASYNGGEGNVARWLKQGIPLDDIPVKETREYVKKVNSNRKHYDRLYKN